MHMKHDLPTFRVGIDYYAVPGQPVLVSKVARDHEKSAHDFGLIVAEVVQRSDVSLRDDDAVERRLRTNVSEHEYLIVSVEFIGR